MSDAVHPADHSTLVTVQIDKTGSVAFAVGVEDSNNAVSPLEESRHFFKAISIEFFSNLFTNK